MIKSLFRRRAGNSEQQSKAADGGAKPFANLFVKVADARKSGQLNDAILEGVDRTEIAAAVLMVEVARLDTDYSDSEIERICSIMRREFGMSLEQANALLDTAENHHDEVYTNWLFTKTIKDKAGVEERTKVMEYLWDIAYADGELDELEADLLLRIGQAIGLTESDRIMALQRVIAKRAPERAATSS